MLRLKLDPPIRISLGDETVLNRLSVFNFANMCEVDALGVAGNSRPTIVRAIKMPKKKMRFLRKAFIAIN